MSALVLVLMWSLVQLLGVDGGGVVVVGIGVGDGGIKGVGVVLGLVLGLVLVSGWYFYWWRC